MKKKYTKFTLLVSLLLLLSIFSIVPISSAGEFHTIYGDVYIDDELAAGIVVTINFEVKTYADVANSEGKYQITLDPFSDHEGQIANISVSAEGNLINNNTYLVPLEESLERVDLYVDTSTEQDDDSDSDDDNDDTGDDGSDDSGDDSSSDGPSGAPSNPSPPIIPIIDEEEDEDETDEPDQTDEQTPNYPPTNLQVSYDSFEKINSNQSIDFSLYATDNDSHFIRYEIDWGDLTTNTTEYVENSTFYNISHSWQNPGRFKITVEAFDKEYNASTGPKSYYIFIDSVQVKSQSLNLDGYLIDLDSNGIYDTFHNNSDEKSTAVSYENDSYYLDTDEDENNDYRYFTNGTINQISASSVDQSSEPIDKDSKDSDSTIYYLIGLIILFSVLFLILLSSRKKPVEKKTPPKKKQTKKSKTTKPKSKQIKKKSTKKTPKKKK